MRWTLAFLAMSGWLAAQPAPPSRNHEGVFLVASTGLTDPNFAESVVLLIDYGRTGAMGVIVNRRTEVPLSKLFPVLPAKARSMMAYEGGPVGRSGALGLVRASALALPDDNARSVVGDVYLVSAKESLDKALNAAAPDAARVYLGYAGWAPGQLERERALGAWHAVPATPSLVFDPDPATLWKRLVRSATSRIARARVHAGLRPLVMLSKDDSQARGHRYLDDRLADRLSCRAGATANRARAIALAAQIVECAEVVGALQSGLLRPVAF
jgi:putative transcriptional regulator